MKNPVQVLNVEAVIPAITYRMLSNQIAEENGWQGNVEGMQKEIDAILFEGDEARTYKEEFKELIPAVKEQLTTDLNYILSLQENILSPELTLITEFMKVGGQKIEPVPTISDEKTQELRVSLIEEELQELKDAIAEGDIPGIFDALLDLQVVVGGAFNAFGLSSLQKQGFEAVHESNMSKFCTSEEEAEETVRHYSETGVDAHYEEVTIGQTKLFVIFRSSDRKILKSINYKPVDDTLRLMIEEIFTI